MFLKGRNTRWQTRTETLKRPKAYRLCSVSKTFPSRDPFYSITCDSQSRFHIENICNRYTENTLKTDFFEYNSNCILTNYFIAMDALAIEQPISKLAVECLLKPTSFHPQHSICFLPSF